MDSDTILRLVFLLLFPNFKPFNEMERLYKREMCILNLLSKTSPVKSIRDSCNDAVSELNKFAIEIRKENALFDRIFF